MNPVYHNSFYAMGTRCHLVLPDMNADEAVAVFAMLRQEVNQVETELSRFIPYSEISQINAKGREEAVAVSDEVFQILQRCEGYGRRTRGAFDITMRPLWQFWKDQEQTENGNEALESLLQKVGMRFVELDCEAHTVRLLNDTIEIDLGGFGKGYALERVDRLLQKFSIDNAFLSFGESSILTRGHHPAGSHWKVGLNDYSFPGRSVYTFELNSGSVSTSSNFFVDDDGGLRKHHHVISPFDGRPLDKRMTASVAAASPETAEILSTASLVLPPEQLAEVALEFPDCEVVTVDYESAEPEVTVFSPKQESTNPAIG